MRTAEIYCKSPSDTMALGASLNAALRAGDVVALNGPLGAGKTTFARGFITAFSGVEHAPSPTYSLVEIYDGPSCRLWHFDLYRLERPDEVWELGLEEALERDIALIEWPDRIEGLMQVEPLSVSIAVGDGGGRIVRITAPAILSDRLKAVGIAYGAEHGDND